MLCMSQKSLFKRNNAVDSWKDVTTSFAWYPVKLINETHTSKCIVNVMVIAIRNDHSFITVCTIRHRLLPVRLRPTDHSV